MNLFTGDFGDVVERRRQELTARSTAQKNTVPDQRLLERRRSIEHLRSLSQQIASLALDQGIKPNVQVIELHEGLLHLTTRHETAAEGWELFCKSRETDRYEQGLERTVPVASPAPRTVYDGMLLTTGGDIVVYGGSSRREAIPRAAGVFVSEFAARHEWYAPTIGVHHSPVENTRHLEAALADFVINHGLDGQAPVPPPDGQP